MYHMYFVLNMLGHTVWLDRLFVLNIYLDGN